MKKGFYSDEPCLGCFLFRGGKNKLSRKQSEDVQVGSEFACLVSREERSLDVPLVQRDILLTFVVCGTGVSNVN